MNGKRGLSKVKRIGILGGMSYKSTIKYYELILQKYYEKYGDYNYPEVIIFSLNFQKVIDYEHGDDKRVYIEYLMNGIKSLENASVDFVRWQSEKTATTNGLPVVSWIVCWYKGITPIREI